MARETIHEPDDGRLTWQSWHEAAIVVADGQHLRRAAVTAAVVGTVLFAINHLDVVLAGDATTRVWVKVAVTYLVPFIVTLVGVLIGTRRRVDPLP